MKPSAYVIGDLNGIKYININDEEQATKPVLEKFSHEINGCIDVSLSGIKVIARTLGVKIVSLETQPKSERICAIARAALKNIQAGAYSKPKWEENADIIAQELAKRNAVKKVVPDFLIPKFLYSRKVYFARSMQIYGTLGDKILKQQLKERAPNWWIIDPAKVITKKGANAMKEAFAIIKNCDALLFAAQNYVSRGVYREVLFALKEKIPVSMLRDQKFTRIVDTRFFEVVDLDWTFYAKLAV